MIESAMKICESFCLSTLGFPAGWVLGAGLCENRKDFIIIALLMFLIGAVYVFFKIKKERGLDKKCY